MLLKKAQLNDLPTLQKVCIEAYSLNFHHHWNPGGLDWYLKREFGDECLTDDLTNATIEYYFILENEIPVGFVKLHDVPYHEHNQHDVIELEKIYIYPTKKGNGIGGRALADVIALSKGRGKKVLFLGVIDTNHPAIAFYKNLGFQFHSKTRLDIPFFKEELKGMNRMRLMLV
ncbi:MAG: GNAT family N-acetyltransferase [Cyclobacteriaceae bacterium]|jgi:ribosomal protein S18 acetylase RimI-like enzyme|nr:GNAT family N-acetyltransferase [Flammeovirgaceae bacterium]